MTFRNRECWIMAALFGAGAIVFFNGLWWGLPSRQADAHLFGSAERAWSGAEIVAAGGAWQADPNRAADADADPIGDRTQLLWINETAKQKAEIFRRYRLFSSQPDEMVTFMALAGMKGGSFDPRMYQYGGMWVYPVGGLLKLASHKWVNLITLTTDLNYYLDRPEAFGRFYVVARVYSGLWGLVGIWAVFRLATRFSKTLFLPTAAAACFLLMPIVINGTHEAKPHLAGAVLVLLAALAATKYVETGRWKWVVVAGVMCGMATGMVLSAGVAMLVIPLMAWLRAGSWRARVKVMGAAAGLAVLVYCVTNPYVPINLVRNPGVVRANLAALGQAKAIVGTSTDVGALSNARHLIAEGASVVGGVIGVTGLLVAAVNWAWWRRQERGRVVAIVLGVPAGLVLVQFLWLAGGKPGEFGRFAVLPDVAMVMVAVIMVSSTVYARAWPAPIFLSLILLVGFQGLTYLAGFLEDARGAESSRRAAARRLEDLWARGARTLAVRADPAPYCLPPVDLTRWKVLLMPADGVVRAGENWPDVIVTPVDQLERGSEVPGTPYVRTAVVGSWPRLKTRISWADKPFEILVKRELVEKGKP